MNHEPDDDEQTDATLVRRMVDQRDESSLESLLRRHMPRIRGYLQKQFGIALNAVGVDDVMNDVAMKLWQEASSIDADKPLGAWLITVARNHSVSLLRSKGESTETLFDEVQVDPIDDEPIEFSEETRRDMNLLSQFANSLRGFERIVMEADIAVGGSADNMSLASLHRKSTNMVSVTRNKVRKKFITRYEQVIQQLPNTEIQA